MAGLVENKIDVVHEGFTNFVAGEIHQDELPSPEQEDYINEGTAVKINGIGLRFYKEKTRQNRLYQIGIICSG